MLEHPLQYGLCYATYVAELGLFIFLVVSGRIKRFSNIAFYLIVLLTVDGAGRYYFLYRYGLQSTQYGYFYFESDAVLVMSAYIVVCLLFRQVCLGHKELWSYLKLTLVMVLLLMLGVTWLTLMRSHHVVLGYFVVVFEQYLYFACLVLSTLLYVLAQRTERESDEVDLLLCGLGIYFAGQAATWALLHLLPHLAFAKSLVDYMSPLCTLGMLGIWSYAVARRPKAFQTLNPPGPQPRNYANPLLASEVR